MKRNLTIKITFNPPISGFSGSDEWIIPKRSMEEQEKFFDELEELVEKHGGEYSGS